MNQLQKITGHLKTINAHRHKVMKLCFRIGLYKQGLKHDLSKYSPCELKTGFKYYQGYRSPIDAQKEDKGYSFSWLHHKGRNPHHWEFWLDNGEQGIHPVAMEFNYVCEMFCDRIAACQIYQKDKYTDASGIEYYEKSFPHLMIHPKTDRQIRGMLNMVKDHGLEYAIGVIKKQLKEFRQTGRDDFYEPEQRE